MKVAKDEPQRLLVLESPAVVLPRAVIGCLGVVLFGFFVGVPAFQLAASILGGARPSPAGLASALVVLLPGATMAALALLGLRRVGRYVQRLSVDRYAGELVIVEHSPLGGSRSRSLRLDTVERILAGSARVKPGIGDRESGVGGVSGLPRLGVRLQIEWRDGGSPRTLDRRFWVENVETREEVADLAYRLARAAGLLYARVVRSDPKEIELELTREHRPGAEPVPLMSGAAVYASDEVAPQAARAAAEERIAAFVPAELKGDLRVTTWEPRRRVVFRKSAADALGCLPFSLLLLTGPALYLYAPLRPADRIPVAVFLGMFGFIIGALALAAVAHSLPRSVVLDWETGAFERRGLFARRRMALSDIRELELTGIRRRHTSKSSSYHTYCYAVVAHLRPDPAQPGGEPRRETLIETQACREDPDTPYRLALPLATELAAALAVPRRVSDYADWPLGPSR